MKKLRLIVVGVIAMALQSCGTVASVGASMGIDPTLFESEEQCKNVSYPQYVKDMKTVNKEQIKQHVNLSRTETVEEYCRLKEKTTGKQA